VCALVVPSKYEMDRVINQDFIAHIRSYIATTVKENNKHLTVATSWLRTIDGQEFDGLFANEEIKAGQVICQYVGNVLRTKEALKLVDKSYLMRLGEQVYVDAKHSPYCLARYINDCRNPAGYNATFIKDPRLQCAWVTALRDIAVGEEIFVDYGKWYWLSLSPSKLTFSQLNKFKIDAKHSKTSVVSCS